MSVIDFRTCPTCNRTAAIFSGKRVCNSCYVPSTAELEAREEERERIRQTIAELGGVKRAELQLQTVVENFVDSMERERLEMEAERE